MAGEQKPDLVEVKVSYNFSEHAKWIDAVNAYVSVHPVTRSVQVHLLGIQVSPIAEEDGTYQGAVVGKWTVDAVAATELAKELIAKLGDVVSKHKGQGDGGTSHESE